LNQVIFGSETRAGRAFDIALIILIFFSIVTVMLDSVESMQRLYSQELFFAEWCFTVLFTVEYLLRLIAVRKPWLYARSCFGIIDILSILPTYLALLLPGVHYMLTLRVLRLLRIFRILKLTEYLQQADILMESLANSVQKILIFMYAVVTLVVVFGSLMYIVEGPEAGFTSIPKSVYWAIVTVTTVGYGDIAPQTPLGQMIAAVIMIMGYGIIAVPTGIYSAELIKSSRSQRVHNYACPSCGAVDHDFDANFCKFCGSTLDSHVPH